MNEVVEKSPEKLRQEQNDILKQNKKVTKEQRELIVHAPYDTKALHSLIFKPIFQYKGTSLSLYAYCSNILRGLKLNGELIVADRYVTTEDGQYVKSHDVKTIHDSIMNDLFMKIPRAALTFKGKNEAEFKTYVYKILKRTANEYFLKEIIGDGKNYESKPVADPIDPIEIDEANVLFVKNRILDIIDKSFKVGTKSHHAVTTYYEQVFLSIANDDDIPSQQDIVDLTGISNSALSDALKKFRVLFKEDSSAFDELRY